MEVGDPRLVRYHVAGRHTYHVNVITYGQAGYPT